MVSQDLVDGLLGPPQFEAHLPRGQVGHVGVVVAVVADGVSFLKNPAQEARVFLDLAADHEEGCLDVVLSQGGKDPGRGARVRAVVESECDPAPEVPVLPWVVRSGEKSPATAAAQTSAMSDDKGPGGSGRVPAPTDETGCTYPNSDDEPP